MHPLISIEFAEKRHYLLGYPLTSWAKLFRSFSNEERRGREKKRGREWQKASTSRWSCQGKVASVKHHLLYVMYRINSMLNIEPQSKHPFYRRELTLIAPTSTLPSGYEVSEKLARFENFSDFFLQDTAGQERFHALGPIYYRDADGALLVYDVTDQDSFAKVKNWVKELRKMLGKEIILCIAGNKIDLERNRSFRSTFISCSSHSNL